MDLNYKRVLIIKPSSLGDVVHALPVAHAIKRMYPHCYVAWIVQNAFSGILESDQAINEIIPIAIPSTSDPYSSRGVYFRAAQTTVTVMQKLRRAFRWAPFDIALDMHASFRSGLFSLMCSKARKIGFSDARELNTLFQDEHVVCPEDAIHAVDKNVAFARCLGVEPIEEDFRLTVGDAHREHVRNILQSEGMGDGGPIIYVNACARWVTKLWNVDSWATVLRTLKERAGVHIVLGGGVGDRTYLEAIRTAAQTDCFVAAGRLNLGESAALLECSDLYVGVDSGPMHIAAFVGTPVVALFGPTDPAKVGPYGQGHRVVRKEELHCLGCRKRGCENRRCMDGLDPGIVAGICLDRLALSPSGGEWRKTSF